MTLENPAHPLLETEPFGDLWRYWNAARGDRMLPDAADIDFTQIAAILPNVSVLDILNTEEIRYQLVGSDIVNRFGGELNGINLLDVISENSRGHLSQSLLDIVTLPCAGFCKISITYYSGTTVTASVLSTPLRTTDQSPGCTLMIQSVEQPARALENDPVAIIGADSFASEYIDIGGGVRKNLNLTF